MWFRGVMRGWSGVRGVLGGNEKAGSGRIQESKRRSARGDPGKEPFETAHQRFVI